MGTTSFLSAFRYFSLQCVPGDCQYAHSMAIFDYQMVITVTPLTSVAAQGAANQHMIRYRPCKNLSATIRSVVKSLLP